MGDVLCKWVGGKWDRCRMLLECLLIVCSRLENSGHKIVYSNRSLKAALVIIEFCITSNSSNTMLIGVLVDCMPLFERCFDGKLRI